MTPARHSVYLITSVTRPTELTDAQLAELFRARWGVEVFYRHFKQTFGRRKLRSHAAANARVELEWSLVGLWAIGLYASQTLVAQAIPLRRLSIARSLQAFRGMARDYLHPAQPRQRLTHQLRRALRDPYQRKDKRSRDYPQRNKNTPPTDPSSNQRPKHKSPQPNASNNQ